MVARMKNVFKLGYGRFSQSRNLVTDAKDKGTGWLSHRKWDAVVVGGGHNGLTAAAYLARAGLDVAVLERRHVLGGAAVTEEIVPGFKFSRGSYLQSLLRPSIIKELELHEHGMKLLPRNPSSFTPGVDGQYLLMGPDADLNISEISKFSKRDAAAYPRYEQQLEQFSSFITPLLDIIPPEISKQGSFSGQISDKISRMEAFGGILKRATSMTQADIMAFMELMLAPASKVLNNWFESDLLKATLATDAIIGTMGSVDTPGSGYVLLHHVMGETNGARGIWSYVEGGMGAVSMAIAKAAQTAGATLVTNAEVDHFAVEKQDDGLSAVTGVVLADGTVIEAKRVLSNATAAATFLKMVPSNVLHEDFIGEITNIDYQSGTTKLNVAVNDLPRFKACSHTQNKPGPEHRGTIHLGADSMGDLLAAHKDACNGYPSARPIIEMTIPSALDKTISPPGKHVINMFVQYTPYHLKAGNWGDSKTREAFAKRCFELVDEYAPGFSQSVIDYEMLAPPDLERIFGLTGGNIFHGAMGLDSLFLLRPVKGWSGYKTPLRDLYLCGSGAHPGGGVMGAPGRNAARVVLQEVGKKLR